MSGVATMPMSPAPPADPECCLWTWGDLERRWQAPGPTPSARRVWVKRRARVLGVRPLVGFGRGESARFRPRNVQDAEARAAGA